MATNREALAYFRQVADKAIAAGKSLAFETANGVAMTPDETYDHMEKAEAGEDDEEGRRHLAIWKAYLETKETE